MQKKRIILLIVLACIAAFVGGYAYYQNVSKPAKTHSAKTVKRQENKSKASKTANKSADKQKNQTSTSAADESQHDETASLKKTATAFYEAAYQKDYTKAKSMMTADFAKQLDALLGGDDSQLAASVVRDISTYTEVSAPTSVDEPSVIQKGQDYEVTLNLGKKYQAKVSMRKEGGTYKVYAFSSQDASMGEGGYAGSSMK